MPSPPEPAPPRPAASRSYLAEEEARRLLSTAGVHLRRGQAAEAERLVHEALTKLPGDAGAQEMLGDIRLAQDDFEGASAAYREALTREPGRVTAEAKLARTSLRQSEATRKQTLGVAYAASGTSLMRGGGEDDPRERTRLAIFSALLPGLGQIVGGEYIKGGLLAIVSVLGWLLLSQTADRSTFEAGVLHGLPLVALILLTLDWLYAVLDAAGLLGRKNSQ